MVPELIKDELLGALQMATDLREDEFLRFSAMAANLIKDALLQGAVLAMGVFIHINDEISEYGFVINFNDEVISDVLRS